MLRGIYAAVSAMKAPLDSIHLIAHNISNSQTIGFKRSESVTKSFQDMILELDDGTTIPMGVGLKTEEIVVDMRSGPLKNTGNKLDVAIQGQGYFVIQIEGSNKIAVTRNGRFSLNKDTQLCTLTNDLVLDTNNRPIAFANTAQARQKEKDISIRENGDVYEDNVKIATIKIELVQQDKALPPGLEKIIGNVISTGQPDTNPKLRQGFVEQANVEIVRELVNFITASKTYEKGQKIISTSDKMLDKAINEMGRMG